MNVITTRHLFISLTSKEAGHHPHLTMSQIFKEYATAIPLTECERKKFIAATPGLRIQYEQTRAEALRRLREGSKFLIGCPTHIHKNYSKAVEDVMEMLNSYYALEHGQMSSWKEYGMMYTPCHIMITA